MADFNPWTIAYVEDTDPLSPTFGDSVGVFLYNPAVIKQSEGGGSAPSQPSGQDYPPPDQSIGSEAIPEYGRMGTIRRTNADYSNTVAQGARVEDEALVHHYRYDFDTEQHTFLGETSSRPKFSTLIVPGVVEGTGWTNPLKAAVQDNDFAKHTMVGGFSEQLVLKNFDVSNIPDGARILGIKVRVRRRVI